jgi:hypothetical protein
MGQNLNHKTTCFFGMDGVGLSKCNHLCFSKFNQHAIQTINFIEVTKFMLMLDVKQSLVEQ